MSDDLPPLLRTLTRHQEMELWAPGNWKIAGTTMVGFAAGIITTLVASLPIALPLIGAGAVTTNWWVARRAMRRFGRCAVSDFSTLKTQPDGTLVHARGVMRARKQLRGRLRPVPAIGWRIDVRVRRPWRYWVELVHVSAHEFDLVDPQGVALPVEVGPSTLLWSTEPGVMSELDGEPAQALSRGIDDPLEVHAGEALFLDGAPAQVVGALQRRAVGDAGALGREPAWGRVLVAAPGIPLMIRS